MCSHEPVQFALEYQWWQGKRTSLSRRNTRGYGLKKQLWVWMEETPSRDIPEVKEIVHIRGIIHIINSLLFKDPLNSQLFKGQVVCARGQLMWPRSPALPGAD